MKEAMITEAKARAAGVRTAAAGGIRIWKLSMILKNIEAFENLGVFGGCLYMKVSSYSEVYIESLTYRGPMSVIYERGDTDLPKDGLRHLLTRGCLGACLTGAKGVWGSEFRDSFEAYMGSI